MIRTHEQELEETNEVLRQKCDHLWNENARLTGIVKAHEAALVRANEQYQAMRKIALAAVDELKEIHGKVAEACETK